MSSFGSKLSQFRKDSRSEHGFCDNKTGNGLPKYEQNVIILLTLDFAYFFYF